MATWNSSVKANREGAAEVNMEATSPNLGEVVSVRGSVVDVRRDATPAHLHVTACG
jgi:hypothetical protein